MSSFRLDHVSKDYFTEGRPVRALTDVSLEASPGEFVALVGRSGCGKSTLLNLAGAMDFPTAGQITLDGVETSSLDDSSLTRLRRDKVGFIFQSFQLLPSLTVIENVELPLLLASRAHARQQAQAALASVDMQDYAARKPFQLSGGQMQRVAIARALVHSPSLLIADEPTGNLDTTTSDLILELLRRVAKESSATVLMATHSLEAAAMADAIVRLRDGHVQEIERACRS